MEALEAPLSMRIRVISLGGALILGGLSPACSCGDDGDSAGSDGAPVDAPSDGPADTATRSGRVTLAQVSLKDDDQAVIDADVRGADFTIAYDDLTTLGVAPSYQDDPAAGTGCTVFEFPGPGMEAAGVDEGPVSVTGFGGIGDFACSFAGTGYSCLPATGATGTVPSGSALSPVGDGTVNANIAGADFTLAGDNGARGMAITFPDGTWNTAINNGTFPITRVSDVDEGIVVIVNPDTMAADAVAAENDYSLSVGQGPVPGGYHLFEDSAGAVVNGQFSVAGGSDETGTIAAFSEMITPATISTADEELVINLVDSNGTMTGPFEPHDLPATEFTISCDEISGGNCESGSPVSALILEGRTTDGALPNTGVALDDATAMPEPAGTYTTFRCIFLGQKIGTISQGALDAILAGSPTRIETRVLYASGAILTDEDGNRVELLSGYGLVGYTDP